MRVIFPSLLSLRISTYHNTSHSRFQKDSLKLFVLWSFRLWHCVCDMSVPQFWRNILTHLHRRTISLQNIHSDTTQITAWISGNTSVLYVWRVKLKYWPTLNSLTHSVTFIRPSSKISTPQNTPQFFLHLVRLTSLVTWYSTPQIIR
jgi:hypothetical protein